MIVSKCIETTKKITDLVQLQKDTQNYLSFQQIFEWLQDLSNRLRPLSQTTDLFLDIGIKINDIPQERVTNLQKGFDSIFASYINDPNTLLNDPTLRATIYSSFSGLEVALRSTLEQSWRNYTSSQIIQSDMVSLDVLGNIPQFSSIISRIRELYGQINNMSNNLPKTDRDIQNFKGKTDELKEKWQNLEGEGIPEEVIAFIRACGIGGANISLLTEEVHDWLIGRGIEESFRVFIR
ncbi:hypothetical protein ACFLUJ_02085 [Chloroflexota bacterium]